MNSPENAAASVTRALGTQQAVNLKYLHFIFTLNDGKNNLAQREYWWNRETGECRLESKEENQKLIALLNTKTKKGAVYEGILPHLKEDQADAVHDVLAWHGSDSFWLLAPTLLTSPGTHLAISGAQTIENKACPTLELTFDQGIAPPAFNKIWLHLDPQTSKPVAWSFTHAGQTLPSTWLWKE